MALSSGKTDGGSLVDLASTGSFESDAPVGVAGSVSFPPPSRLQRLVNRGRLLSGIGLLLFLAAGGVGHEQAPLFGTSLVLAFLLALGQEWLLGRGRALPLAGGLADGVCTALLVSAAGGPRSGLDPLFAVAIVALAAQSRPRAALLLATLDVSLYAVTVLAPGEASLAARALRLFFFGLLGGGAYVASRAIADARAAAVTAEKRFREERRRGEVVRQAVLGRANLIAMLSHDLRTPLTSVKGFAQLILRDRETPDLSQHYVEVILTEANRAIRTISDAVDLARIQGRQVGLQRTWVELRPIVESAALTLRPQDPEGRIRLNLPIDLPLAHADPIRLERVMVNLLSNALRYAHDGSPIEVGASGDAGGVTIWVEDQGQGIPPEKFAHVFDLDIEDLQGECEFNGSGLGLYISKYLVEAHGGQMWVESVDGRGPRFAFRLKS